MAMDRIGVGLTVTSDEYDELHRQTSAAGLSVPQYIRTRCEFPVRWSSLPGTQEREQEEDEAWQRLKRLGLKPQEYFPEET